MENRARTASPSGTDVIECVPVPVMGAGTRKIGPMVWSMCRYALGLISYNYK